MSEKQTGKSNKRYGHWLFWWVLDENELQDQVDNYNNQKWYGSYRSIAALLLIFSAVLTIIMVSVGWVTQDSTIDVIAFLILALFIFRGHKWAMISAMLLWTFEKIYLIYIGSGAPIVQIIWWTIYMHAFFGAFKVELLRRKQANVIEGGLFCSKCGVKNHKSAIYCRNCGNKMDFPI